MKDNFSKQAGSYARYRPSYPVALYDYIYSRCTFYGTAWDCATGNGQVASQLAERFTLVVANDISQEQLKLADKKKNISYKLGTVETTSIKSNSIDLVTVGQAIHWFDFGKFYKEVCRVAKPECVLAYWAYSLPEIDPQIDKALQHFHDVILGAYWDEERNFWRQKYKNIKYPLRHFGHLEFNNQVLWSSEDFEGYLNSWSSVQHFIAKNRYNPVTEFIKPLKAKWTEPRTVSFPIFLYAGLV